ncbi:MAG: FliH/SctL family protein, partial [Chloroflexota bacterium]
AEASAAALKRDAVIRGYNDGQAEGFRAAQEQCQEYLERIAELARRAAIDREGMIRSAEKELASLAIEIATKVIKQELQTEPSIVLTMVENALAKVGEGDSVKIIVNPEDAELVRAKWSELRGAVAFGDNWEIIGDEQMERGGCKVETRGGFVDSSIETQLAEITYAFEVEQ